MRNIGKRLSGDSSGLTGNLYKFRDKASEQSSDDTFSEKKRWAIGWRNIGKRLEMNNLNDAYGDNQYSSEGMSMNKRGYNRFWKLVRRNPMKFRNIGKRSMLFRNIGKRMMRFRNIGKRVQNLNTPSPSQDTETRFNEILSNIGTRRGLALEDLNDLAKVDLDFLQKLRDQGKRKLGLSSYSKKGTISCPPYMSKVHCYNNVIAYYIRAMQSMSWNRLIKELQHTLLNECSSFL